MSCGLKVRDVATGQLYAMKHMRLMGEAEAITDCMTEVNTLKKLRDVPTILTLRSSLTPPCLPNLESLLL